MEDLINGSSNAISRYEFKKRIFVLCLRWLLIATAIMYLFAVKDKSTFNRVTYAVLVAVFLYNLLTTLYGLESKKGMKNMSTMVAHLDIIEISLLCFQTGGISSEIYLIYFFTLCNRGLYSSIMRTITTGMLCIIAYTFTVLFFNSGMNSNEYLILGLRDFYILAASFSVIIINREIRKYEELHKKEFKLARTDRLTGLANRHYFEQKLTEETKYSDLSGMPINILIFDIDNFKKFNDTYGHISGDKLLTLFADIIKMNIRKPDIPIRYGGEEFLILIRDIDRKTARNVAERIRDQLEKHCIYLINSISANERIKVTVSCGLAQYPADSGNIHKAVELADKALYKAKKSGKNMVVCYDENDNSGENLHISDDNIHTPYH